MFNAKKKTRSKKALLAVLSALLGLGGISAVVAGNGPIEEVGAVTYQAVETWDFTAKSSSHSSYTDSWTYDNQVSVTHASNNSAGWAYLRVGGKETSSGTSSLASVNKIEEDIYKINLTAASLASRTSYTCNSITLQVASDSNFSNIIDTVSGVTVALSMEWTPTSGDFWASGSYYRLNFAWSNNNRSNGGMNVEKVVFSTEVPPVITLANPSYSGSTIKGATFDPASFHFDATVDGVLSKKTGTDEGVTIYSDEFTTPMTSTSTFDTAGEVQLYYSYSGTNCTEPLTLTIADQAVSVSGVTITPETAEIAVGGTLSLTATVAPEDATNKAVTWTSSDQTVATVENGLVTAIKAGTATITVTTVEGSFTDTCAIEVYTDYVTSLAIEGQTTKFPANGAFALGDEAKITATYRSGKTEEVAASDCTFILGGVEINIGGTLSTIGTHEVVVGYNGGSATYSINVYESVAGQITDTLTRATTGLSSGAGYSNWSDKTAGESGAVYAGQSAGGNDAIQIRNEKPAGIITTKSGGIVDSITVSWNSGTASSRSLTIYGKNTAYTSSADLYDEATRGTQVGTIARSATTLDNITTNYAYIGIIVTGGAGYLESISIVWNTNVYPEKSAAIAANPSKTSYNAGDTFNAEGLSLNVTYSDGSTKAVTYTGNEDCFSFADEGKLTGGQTSIVGTYKQYTTAGIEFTITGLTVAEKTLTQIVIANQPSKTSYTLGDTLDYTGITVTASYSDTSTATIQKAELTFSRAEGDHVSSTDVTNGKIDVTVSYESQTTTLTLTVVAATNVYTKVDSLEDLELGATYTFGYEDAASNEFIPVAAKEEGAAYYSQGAAIYTDGGQFVDNDSILEFTLAPGATASTYALWSDSESGYIGHTGTDGGNIPTGSTFSSEIDDLTISITDGVLSIAIGEFGVEYNKNYGRFAFYKTTGNMYDITLYKRYEAANSYYSNATAWANDFLEATGAYCGEGKYGSIANEWADITTLYALADWSTTVSGASVSLTTQVEKDFIIRGIAPADRDSTTDPAINRALARYDFCVSAYGLEGFLTGRTVASSIRYTFMNNEDSSRYLIAFVGVGATALVTGAFLFMKKKASSRKEEEE